MSTFNQTTKVIHSKKHHVLDTIKTSGLGGPRHKHSRRLSSTTSRRYKDSYIRCCYESSTMGWAHGMENHQPVLGRSNASGPKLCGSKSSSVVSRRLTPLLPPLPYPAGTSKIGILSAQNSRITCRQMPHGASGCATSLETNLR